MRYLFLLLLSSFYLLAQPLEIVYEQRIPYVEKTQNSISGLVATPAIKALNKAKIDYILKEKPSKRHLYEIEANTKRICALGWFKNKHREKFAKYTLSLYQDNPLGIIAKSDRKSEFLGIDIDTLLKKPISILTKESYSYGEFLDKKLKLYKVRTNSVYIDNEKMVTLIKNNRADFMFISPEEAKLLLKDLAFKDISFYKIKGIPKGNKRYLICSKRYLI